MQRLKQRYWYDCYPTCIAMISGIPYDELWTTERLLEIEKDKGAYGQKIDDLWAIAGFEDQKDYWEISLNDSGTSTYLLTRFLRGRRAVIQVPSLNMPPPNQHVVVWDGSEVFDPSTKQCYSNLHHMNIQRVTLFNEVRGNNVTQ